MPDRFGLARSRYRRPAWLPDLDRAVWLLVLGRVLLQLGSGFVLFYASIYFVNEVKLSATSVGSALGAGQLTGLAARLLAGSLADSPRWGRRRVLVLAAIVSLIADSVLFFAQTWPLLLVGNLFMGAGIGLYWPAMEALVADLTPDDRRREAYAITRLSDVVGLGLGTIAGGLLLGTTGLYRWIFVADGLSFVVFGALIQAFIPDGTAPRRTADNQQASWQTVLHDRSLWIFVVANLAFTTYIAQTETTLPVYFKNVVGFSSTTVSLIFTGHIVLAAIAQLPATRLLRRFSHPRSLALTALVFGLSFVGLWWAGQAGGSGLIPLITASVSMAILAVAIVSYTPVGSAFVVDLAPDHARGVYLSVNSLCWAGGYLIGPPLGGLALDAAPPAAQTFWLWLSLSTIAVVVWLQWLERSLDSR